MNRQTVRWSSNMFTVGVAGHSQRDWHMAADLPALTRRLDAAQISALNWRAEIEA